MAGTQLSPKKKAMEGCTLQLSPMLKEDASQLSPTSKDGTVSKNTATHIESCISMTWSLL